MRLSIWSLSLSGIVDAPCSRDINDEKE